MPAPQLTVHNAEIKTATVEIKTLTVSGKQVTLAVFRQLFDGRLIADDGTLNGTPWGIVNYHPDKCDDGSNHIHLVWQEGSDLRRSTVRAPQIADWPGQGAREFAELLLMEGDARAHREKDDLLQEVLCGTDRSGIAWVRFVYRGVRFLTSVSDDAYFRRKSLEVGRTRQELASLLPADDYLRAWEQLNTLPQLFIAV